MAYALTIFVIAKNHMDKEEFDRLPSDIYYSDRMNTTDSLNSDNYTCLINGFMSKGYRCLLFDDNLNKPLSDRGGLLLRHDIDFSIPAALAIARIEKNLGLRSSYYFMLSSMHYNPIETKTNDMIKQIRSLGHSIGLHFDPTPYSHIAEGLQAEINIFEQLFSSQIKLISIHRPSPGFFGSDPISLPGNRLINHTYQQSFFKDIEYISDSGGSFRYGHPLDSEAFANNQTIQLLLHPIWWIHRGQDPIDKISHFISDFNRTLSRNIADNCKPWEHHLQSIYESK